MKTFLRWVAVPVCAIIGGILFKWVFSLCFDANCGFSVSELARTYTFGGHILLVINYTIFAEALTAIITTFIAMYFAPKYKKRVGYIILTIAIIALSFIMVYANMQYNVKMEENILMAISLVSNIVGIICAIKLYKDYE